MFETPSPAPVRLVAIPRLAAGGRWRVEAMRSISEPLLLWFTKGQGRITVAGATRGYTAHNAVFIPADVMHGFEIGPQVFGTAVYFQKRSDVPLPAHPHHLRLREASAQHELNILLDMIAREMDSSAPGSDRAVRCHVGLLSVWLERQVSRSAAEPLDAGRRLVARYTALVEKEFRSGMGVAQFAAALGVTPTHLSRCCRQACGRPALDLLQDRLIFEARRLLVDSDLPVNRIAAALGFTSPAYFTRAFGHLTGQSPSSFRRSHQRAAGH